MENVWTFSYLKEPNQSIRSQRTRIENLQIRKSTILSKRKAKMVKQFQKYRIHYTGRNVIFNMSPEIGECFT